MAHLTGSPQTRPAATAPTTSGRAVAGKTVSRRLIAAEADLYREWIANRRELERIVASMEQVSAAAGEILLRRTAASEAPSRTRR